MSEDSHAERKIIIPPKKRKVIINGRTIGEVEETGDVRKDLEAASKLIEAAGMGGKPPLEWTMYKHAQAFAKLANYVLGTHVWKKDGRPHSDEDMRNTVPFVVNAALAIELYLKTLHALFGGKATGHLLLKLYDGLATEAKLEIDQRMPAREKEFKLEPPGTFRGYVESLDRAFVDWRYVYELDYSGSINFAQMMCVLATAEDACRTFGNRLSQSRKAGAP